MLDAENEWMRWVSSLSAELQRLAIQRFCRQYFYFSTRQVIAFSGIFRSIDPLHRDVLAELADVLSEELGRGSPDMVHSVLLQHFADEAGLSETELILPESEVVAGVRDYVRALNAAFSGSRARALAAYQFLESSAVLTYQPLYDLFRRAGFSDHALGFFELHAQVEADHAATADRLVARYSMSAEEQSEFDRQRNVLSNCWDCFWRDLLADAQGAIEGR